MTASHMAWTALAIYVFITVVLTIRGALRTKGLASFALGSKDIPPAMGGISLTAQMTSVATFVLNPGLVYQYGISGLLGFGMAAALGITFGLIAFSRRFLTTGSRIAAFTVPQWIGKRYQSQGLTLLFAVISLALIAFSVLIVVAIAVCIVSMLSLNTGSTPFSILLCSIVAFFFTYIMLGGVNTHAYTNSIQGIVMLVVALILISSGWPLLFKNGGILASLRAIDPNLVSLTNPASLYFRDFFEVFVCNFLVGLAIVCQPHIVSKVLYLKSEKQVTPYLLTAIMAGLVFSTVMVVGLFARVSLPVSPFLSSHSDLVIPTYIAANFTPLFQVLITMGLICAGVSTLEGILLSLLTILSNDIFLPLLSRGNTKESEQVTTGKALSYGRAALVLTGVVVIWLSNWQINNPTGGSVVIFGMYGVYLLFTASFFPLSCGMFLPRVTKNAVTAGVIASIAVYCATGFFHFTHYSNNPAFLSTAAIIAGWTVIGIWQLKPAAVSVRP
ncbi:MAG: sodium:solute symporter [Candidatus Wallbacteria bacterium]|nr:sodium:solute symporter [Candidatus Wallbacteria bacterium]